MKKPEFLRLLRLNFFKLLGALVGLIIAVLLLTLGFWRTILITLCVGGGTIAGAWLDRGQKLMDVVDRIFPGSASEDDDYMGF